MATGTLERQATATAGFTTTDETLTAFMATRATEREKLEFIREAEEMGMTSSKLLRMLMLQFLESHRLSSAQGAAQLLADARELYEATKDALRDNRVDPAEKTLIAKKSARLENRLWNGGVA